MKLLSHRKERNSEKRIGTSYQIPRLRDNEFGRASGEIVVNGLGAGEGGAGGGLLGGGDMEGDVIALLKDDIPIFHQLDVIRNPPGKGVVSQHPYIKTKGRLFGHQLADIACPESP